MKPEYRIGVRGQIPNNLQSRISAIHATALLQRYKGAYEEEKHIKTIESTPTNPTQNGLLSP